MITGKNLTIYTMAIGMVVLITIVYKYYFASYSTYFPKCPFKVLTGLQCPGCGTQRAIHHILNLNISRAFKENVLLVVSIPYLLLAFLLTLFKNPNKKLMDWKKILYGKKTIYIILLIIFSFWILRNIYPEYV